MKRYVEINSTLAYLFDRWVIENPQTLEELPPQSKLVMQLEGHEDFNAWARQLSAKHPLEKGQKLVYVVFRFSPKLTPKLATPNRIVNTPVEELDLQPA